MQPRPPVESLDMPATSEYDAPMVAWSRIIVHADMDAFYASVEQRDNPELKGKPVLIGPNSHRGVVLTASYEARPYGVGSAMPVVEARRRCPVAIMVPPRFERYQSVSKQVMDVFSEFSPYVEALSLDEAFLDMSGAAHFFGPPAELGAKIKAAVLKETGLNISVGVSATKYVAKVASGHDKPDGLTIVAPEEASDWLAPMPVNRLWGAGKKTAAKLKDLGFHTIGDVACADPNFLSQHLGQTGARFHELANARDPRPVTRGRRAKSIGSERTLNQDVHQRDVILRHLRRSAERIARRVRSKHYVAAGLRIRLKTAKFEMLTRQRKFPSPVDTADEFMQLATTLLDELNHPGPFRLIGMAVFDLDWNGKNDQGDLFADPKNRKLEIALDALTEKFGTDTVVRARDMNTQGTVAKDGVNLDYLDYRDGERISSPD